MGRGFAINAYDGLSGVVQEAPYSCIVTESYSSALSAISPETKCATRGHAVYRRSDGRWWQHAQQHG
jgi:hypothetical protein